jgi:hypothetical protein
LSVSGHQDHDPRFVPGIVWFRDVEEQAMFKKKTPPLERASLVWILQGVYYLITGVWALVGIRSFQKITGPKDDVWLVKTVGLLVTVTGGVLLSAGLRRETAPEIQALAVGSALSLGGVGLWYSLRGRISKVYLLDTVAEVVLVTLWTLLRRDNGR